MASGWLAVLAGFLFHYYNAKLQEERRARLERVNDQLREFYGPLLACVSATKSAYDAMVRQHSHDGTLAAFQQAVAASPQGPEAKAYRLWMSEVLQPLNEKAARIIQERIDLLDAATVVPELLQLVAHVSTLKVILQRWQDNDFSSASVISYPDKLLEFVQREFVRVKQQQAHMLGTPPKAALQQVLKTPLAKL